MNKRKAITAIRRNASDGNDSWIKLQGNSWIVSSIEASGCLGGSPHEMLDPTQGRFSCRVKGEVRPISRGAVEELLNLFKSEAEEARAWKGSTCNYLTHRARHADEAWEASNE